MFLFTILLLPYLQLYIELQKTKYNFYKYEIVKIDFNDYDNLNVTTQ